VVGKVLVASLRLTVDTLMSYLVRADELYNRYSREPSGHVFACSFINSALDIMEFHLQAPIPFHDRFLINIANNSGASLAVTWTIGYYVVT